MKATLLTALLLLATPVFGQIAIIDDTSCSAVTDSGVSVVIPCTPVVVEPPPPEPQGITRVVAFGDSWTDDDRYQPWAESLANEIGVPITNYAQSGARSWQIEQQVAQAVSQGIDPDALYTYWIFPNDFYDYGYFPENAYPAIEQNAYDAFEMLVNAGAQNILILTLPDGENYPIFSAYGTYGTQLTDGANTAVNNAAVQFGLSMYPAGDFIDSLTSCWYDQQHLCRSIHDQLAAEIAENF